MNQVIQLLAPRAFALIFAASVAGLAGCSTGTDSGDTNVEYGSDKNKNPENQNREGGTRNTDRVAATHQDSIDALMDTAKLRNDPYERARKPENVIENEPRRR